MSVRVGLAADLRGHKLKTVTKNVHSCEQSMTRASWPLLAHVSSRASSCENCRTTRFFDVLQLGWSGSCTTKAQMPTVTSSKMRNLPSAIVEPHMMHDTHSMHAAWTRKKKRGRASRTSAEERPVLQLPVHRAPEPEVVNTPPSVDPSESTRGVAIVDFYI